MTVALAMPSFRSSRAEQRAPQAAIVMISPNNGLCQMIRVALQGDDPAGVDVMRVSLADVAASGAVALQGYQTIVFECRPSDPAEMAALRTLTSGVAPGTRFLAVTDEMLSLSAARLLMDAGVEEVLPLMAVQPQMAHAVDLASDLQSADRGAATKITSTRLGAIIAVARARGGVGATTVAVNLALGLSTNKTTRTVLLDLDLQHGDAGFYLDVEDQGALIGMISNGTTPDATFLRTAVTDHKSGLHVLPAPQELVPLQALTSEMVAELLTALQRDYDHIVIDMPQALVDWIGPILARASKVLVVTDTSVPAIRQTVRLITAYAEDAPALPVEIVVSGEAKPYMATAAHKAAERALERPLSHWVPRDAVAARRAIDRGAALGDVAPRSPMTKALRGLAAKVLTDCAAAATKTA